MGLFSSHRNQQSGQSDAASNPNSRIHVLLRSQATSDGESSSEPRTIWSICVEQTPSIENTKKQARAPTKNKSMFNLKRRQSSQSADPQQSSNDNTTSNSKTSRSKSQFTEFILSDGNLHVSRPTSSIPIIHQSLDNDHSLSQPEQLDSPSGSGNGSDGGDEGILLQIQLPQSQSQPQSQTSVPLVHRIEQVLHSTTSANATTLSTSTDTDIWLQFALIALQHAHILPPPTAHSGSSNNNFNVNDFMSYARNQFTEFEAEILSHANENPSSSSAAEVEAHHVKQINYQTHLDENARLRALFGHATATAAAFDSTPTSATGVGIQNARGREEGVDEHQHAHGHGGWWVSRPQSQSQSRPQSRDGGHGYPRSRGTVDPYGGLM